MLKNRYQGVKYTVVHCKGALKSYKKALNSVDARKKKKFTRQIILQIKRLADGKTMSRENFPREGILPKRVGQHTAKNFYALKRIPIRGYCWKSDSVVSTYFISHYINKNYDNLKDSETEKVCSNWKRIEVNEDEC